MIGVSGGGGKGDPYILGTYLTSDLPDKPAIWFLEPGSGALQVDSFGGKQGRLPRRVTSPPCGFSH